MVQLQEKIEAALMLSSYFETVGFNNATWEFNYRLEVFDIRKYINMLNTMVQHFLILGGASNINVKQWIASDDTILILAIAEAASNGGGEDNYIKSLITYYELLKNTKRVSGNKTLESINKLEKGYKLKNIEVSSSMGGNGAAIRTGPIGIKWSNNIEKVIEQSILSSRLTHNYYLGFLGGMVTALFTAFAINNIDPWLWCDELIALYNKKIIHKYYPTEACHNINDLDIYMGYWKRYKELRINKIEFKNTLENCIFILDRIDFLLGFYPDKKIKEITLKGDSLKEFKNFNWGKIGASGLDVCIYAYDCLLMSMTTPGSVNLDMNNILFSFDSFLTLVSIHPGDNDSTGAIGGFWYGALLGYKGIDKNRMKELEFYSTLLKISKQLK
jgi:ADP-ribosylarginine hydrolase